MTETTTSDQRPPAKPVSVLIGSIAAVLALVGAIAITIGFAAEPNDDEIALALASVGRRGEQSATGQASSGLVEATAAPSGELVSPVPAPPLSSEPRPTPTPVPTREPALLPTPTPLPTPTVTPVPTAAYGDFVPEPLSTGPVRLAIAGGVSFTLRQQWPAVHYDGVTGIYIDDLYLAEVDILNPLVDSSSIPLDDFEAVVGAVTRFPMNLTRVESTVVGGHPAAIFEGSPAEFELAFFTTTAAVRSPDEGWYVPGQLRLWMIDGPSGVIVVSAEALNSAPDGDFDVALSLAEQVISTMTLD